MYNEHLTCIYIMWEQGISTLFCSRLQMHVSRRQEP